MSFCKCDVHVFGVMRACWIFTLELFGHKVKLFHSTTKLFNPSAKLFCQTVSLSDLSSLPFHKQCINIPFAPQSHPHLTFLVFLILSIQFSSVQLLSRVRLFATPWIAARQAFPVHHQLLEFTQTHVHWVSDAMQPSHPLSSTSPPAPSPSQHQSLFQWVNSSHEVAKVLEFQL